jgi:hypothetical protein
MGVGLIRGSAAALGVAMVATLGGCLSRKLSVTSEPPGATVYANDIELGRTPLEAAFTYYGSYDVRVELDGYEPIRRKVIARAPIYEYPPIDLLAIAMPFRIDHTVRWNFKLEPMRETTEPREALEKGMLDRAAELRREIR